MTVTHVIVVLDEENNHEAVYVGGVLKLSDYTLHLAELVGVTEGMTIQLSRVAVRLPEHLNWPRDFENLMQYVVNEEEPQQ